MSLAPGQIITIDDEPLTKNFRLYEFLRSETAAAKKIDNTPTPTIVAALRRLAEEVQLVRDYLAAPMTISSGYRCLALNRAVGSKDSSDHVKGCAIDFIADARGSVPHIAKLIASSTIPYKQLILEGPGMTRGGNLVLWVHLSFDFAAMIEGRAPKRENLTIARSGTLAGLRPEALV